MKPTWKQVIAILLGLTGTISVFLGLWVWSLNSEVEEKLRTRRFLPPTEFYTAPAAFYAGDSWTSEQVQNLLLSRNYALSPNDRALAPGRFWAMQGEGCVKALPQVPPASQTRCLIFSPQETPDPFFAEQKMKLQALLWGEDPGMILQAYQGNPLSQSDGAFAEPQLFAQYLGSTPVLQSWTPLGETPLPCLNAVLAIEDANFLEHGGVSFLGMGRAALKNFVRGRVAQGGSTITQQMVKNFFLTSERTLKRKVTEIVMSLLLELHANKDDIFETYLNIIYMGQSGPFEVRGFGAAARHYFGQDLSQLELHQCSLLAAILNSPGGFDPERHPEKSLERRNRVLDRMAQLGLTPTEEVETAKRQPLPKLQRTQLWETAPYYIQAALSQVQQKGLATEGLQIFTGLIPTHQAAAQKAVQSQIEKLEKENPRIHKIAEKGVPLEGLLLSMDLHSNWITAAVGGRSYRKTQYNRILDGHRQVGSLMKPFVYYSALQKNPSLNALSPVQDVRFSYKFEGQTWSPENYGKKFFGEVPLYFALKNSLNAATAALGIEAGIDNLIKVVTTAGETSPLKPFPSLTLGAFELYPTEVLEMYATLGHLGERSSPIWVRSARQTQGDILLQNARTSTAALDPMITSEVVGMMKQTVQTGTAQAVFKSGFTWPAAGKTGTTSDSRDAWFSGFTPDRLTVAWLGYDQKETHNLTGGSGTVPIWIDFMKSVAGNDSHSDFKWPASVRIEKVQPPIETQEIELVLPAN